MSFGKSFMVIVGRNLYHFCEYLMRVKILFISLLFRILSFVFEVLSNVCLVHLDYFLHIIRLFVYSFNEKLKLPLLVIFSL